MEPVPPTRAALNVIGPRYLGDIMDLVNTQVDLKLQTGAMDFGAIFGILGTILREHEAQT